MRRLTVLFFLFLFLPAVSATEIASENMTITLGEPSHVTVTQRYTSIDTEKISYLVPATYNPKNLRARDGIGPMDCSVRRFETGREILCTPRVTENYTVTIQYTGEFSSFRNGHRVFSYEKGVSVPLNAFRLRVLLPEGTGLIDTKQPYTPSDGRVGSEGRRIFLEWTADSPQLADRFRYRIAYEQLAVVDKYEPLIYVLGMLVIVLAAAGGVIYLRRTREQRKTIASVFPVLKEDEQEVLRYIIDEEGEVEQRQIVSDMSYSKAKVSRLISDLEERNLLEKEKAGRVNVVRLTREVGDIGES